MGPFVARFIFGGLRFEIKFFIFTLYSFRFKVQSSIFKDMKKRHYFLSLKCHEGWQAILYRIFIIPSFLRRKTRTRTPKKKKSVPVPFTHQTLKKNLLRSFSVPRFQKTTRTCSVPVLKFQNQPVYVPFPFPYMGTGTGKCTGSVPVLRSLVKIKVKVWQ